MNTPRIYLDVCCFNRPFDDQSQIRIRLETEAVLDIISRCEQGAWVLLSSEILELEVSQTPDDERRERIQQALAIAQERIELNDTIENRAVDIQKLGFHGYDALHLASAEFTQATAFLSTDDRLLKRAGRYAQEITVATHNPVNFLMSCIEEGEKE